MNDSTTTTTNDGAAAAAAATTATTTATPALLPTKLTEGQIVCGKIAKFLDYGVTVVIDGERALLKDDQFGGGSNSNRRVNRKTAKIGDEIAVEVSSIRPPAADDKSKVKSNRIRVSQRSIQDNIVLEALKPATDTEEGTILTGRIHEVRKDFALVELTEGPAAGYLAILHALHVPGSGRPDRDAYIDSLKARVGEIISGECLHCDRAKEAHIDLRIGMTLVAEARRSTRAALSDTSKKYKGKPGRNCPGGIEVTFGPSDAPMVGILPSHEMPSNMGPSVWVKIASQSGDRIMLTRKGC
jgi:ribosomal protein S1